MPATGFPGTIKQTFSEFSNDDCGTLAAALAYYTVFSLPAMLLIVVTIVGSVFGRAAVQGTIQQQLSGVMGPQTAAQVQTMVANAGLARGAGILATILGTAGLIWSATNVMSQLRTALNRAWQVEKQTSIRGEAGRRITSFLLILAVGLVVIVFLAVSAAAASFVTSLIGLPGPVLEAAQAIVSWIVFTFLFGAVFKIIPDAAIDWSDVRAGAMVTAALFVIGKVLIGLYLGHTSAASAYGVAGSLALLLLWTYYSSMIFLLGAEFTQVWARAHGTRIRPSRGAVLVERKPTPGEERPAA